MKVLRIDTYVDELTRVAYIQRDATAYPEFANRGFDIIPPLHTGTIAKRHDVVPLAKSTRVVLITGTGHGDVDRFLGDYDCNIFPKDSYSPAEVSNKIIHLLACSVGASLGPDFIKNGCKTFIGYDAPFTYEKAWADVFFRCDMQIDLALANGKYALEAVQAAKDQFMLEMQKAGNAPIASELKNRCDSLLCIGENLRIDPQQGLMK